MSINPLLDLRPLRVHRFQIGKRAMRKLAAAFRRKLFRASAKNALHTRRQFVLKYVRVSSEIISRIVDGMIHQVVRGIVVVQVGPGA